MSNLTTGLELLIPDPEPRGDSYRWGRITKVDPLAVVLEGEEAEIFPSDSTWECVVGERVYVQLRGTRATVVGMSGAGLPKKKIGEEIENAVTPVQDAVTEMIARLNDPVMGLDATQAKANAAASKAEDARQAAADAHNEAMGASAASVAAVQEAARAAGIAAGKSDSWISAAEPPVELRKQTTLWIDLTGGANTPKRWNSIAWVAIPDKAAVDAANAAVAADQKAAQALTSADGKSTVFYQSAVPVSPKQGDRWYNLAGKAQIYTGSTWRDTTPGEGFVPQLDIGRATIGDMQVGRLTGENSSWKTSAINSLLANTAFIRRIFSSQVSVGPMNVIDDPGLLDVELRARRAGLSGDIVTASSRDGINNFRVTNPGSKVANICLTNSSDPTQDFYAGGATVTPGTKIRLKVSVQTYTGIQWRWTAWVVKSDGARQYIAISPYFTQSNSIQVYESEWTVPESLASATFGIQFAAGTTAAWAEVSQFEAMPLVGAIQIADGAVTAPKITASELLSAKVGEFLKITTSMLEAGGAKITGTMLAAIVQITNRLIAGDPAGDRTELNSTGIHLWKGGEERVRLSTDSDNGLQVWNPGANILMDASSMMFGSGVFAKTSTTQLTPGGFPNWGAWTMIQLGTWTAPTPRCASFFDVSYANDTTLQNNSIRAALVLIGGGKEIVLSDTNPSGNYFGGIGSRGSGAILGYTSSLTPGVAYTVRAQFQSRRTPSGVGDVWITPITAVIFPN